MSEFENLKILQTEKDFSKLLKNKLDQRET